MSVYAGPANWWFKDIDNGRTYVATKKIIQNGLVLNLDAGASSSYPGSGTTWTDLSGNGNSGNLTNGPTFDAGNGGNIVYDGTNDYVDIPFQPVQSGTAFTLSTVVQFSDWENSLLKPIVDSGYFFNIEGTGYTLWKNRATGLLFAAGSTTTINVTLTNNTWYDITCTAANSNPYALKVYINGVEQTPASGVSSSTFTSISSNIRCFSAANGFASYLPGKQAVLRMYNRALSAAEVLQNFNAIRGRFGI